MNRRSRGGIDILAVLANLAGSWRLVGRQHIHAQITLAAAAHIQLAVRHHFRIACHTVCLGAVEYAGERAVAGYTYQGITVSSRIGITALERKRTRTAFNRILPFASKVVEPLVKSGRGFIGVFEKKDRIGDGSFEVIGAQSPLKCVDPATVTRNENENGGAWNATLQSTEVYAESVFFDTDYATTLAAFETLLARAFE